MPQIPYIVTGTVETSKGKISNSRVVINSDIDTLTNSSGQYVLDLANLQDGYTAGQSFTIEAFDKFNNETSSGSLTVSGQNQVFNITLSARTTAYRATDYSPKTILHSVGKEPITKDNPLPVSDTASDPVANNFESGGKIAVGTTAVEITFGITTSSIIISAATANTGTLYLGKSDVASDGSNAILFLEAGESVNITYEDSSNALFVISDTAAQNFFKGALKKNEE